MESMLRSMATSLLAGASTITRSQIADLMRRAASEIEELRADSGRRVVTASTTPAPLAPSEARSVRRIILED